MRIVQTFWTAGRDPLEHSFGWLRPEYNLMSWALSCLSLREHYDEVALYTDEQGKHVLIDLLHLPYTEVNVVYDEHLCLPQHWAYAKIKTYSLQTKPFLHVDGDVYLPKPIPEEIISSPLIAQNREIGTGYYQGMLKGLLQVSGIRMTDTLDKDICSDSLLSYNMGVFGGSDLNFIHSYCEEAMSFCNSNKSLNLNGNFNILFEQILFAYFAEREKQPVNTIFSKTYNDNGYSAGDFCNLDRYREKTLFHLLGGHKRNKGITESLSDIFLSSYGDYYVRLVSAFPLLHQRGFSNGIVCMPVMNTDLPIQSYIEFLNGAEEEWSTLSWDELMDVEKRRVAGKALSYIAELPKDMVICRNPYLKCFDVPAAWDEGQFQIMRKRLSCKEDVPIQKVAVIPTLTPRQRKENILHELEGRVLDLIWEHPMQVSDLLTGLASKSEDTQTLWLMETRLLLNEGLVIPYNKNIQQINIQTKTNINY